MVKWPYVKAEGQVKTITEWLTDPRVTCSPKIIWTRISKGMSPEEALFTPKLVNVSQSERLYRYLRENGPSTTRDLYSYLHISRIAFLKVAYKLQEQGQLCSHKVSLQYGKAIETHIWRLPDQKDLSLDKDISERTVICRDHTDHEWHIDKEYVKELQQKFPLYGLFTLSPEA